MGQSLTSCKFLSVLSFIFVVLNWLQLCNHHLVSASWQKQLWPSAEVSDGAYHELFIPSLFRSIVPWIKKYGTNPITGEVSNDGWIHIMSLLSLCSVFNFMCLRNNNALVKAEVEWECSFEGVWKKGEHYLYLFFVI